MNNAEDLSSEESDVDYVPEGVDVVLPSEEESDGDPEEDTTTEGKKRSKGRTKNSKKVKKTVVSDSDDDEPPYEKPLTEDERKKKTDSLWADFLKDTNTKPKPKSADKIEEQKNKTADSTSGNKSPVAAPKKEEKKIITKIFEFAGEEVRVTKEVPADSSEAKISVLPSARGKARGSSGGGLSSVLNQLGKKEKISTLEKSKLDWDRFKKDEKIEEELQSHNKGKDGYLDKQDFLQRADLRQFELEKEFRTKQRSHRL